MKIILFILCWFFLGLIGFLINHIHIINEKIISTMDEEDIVVDFISSIVLGFIYFISVMIVLIGIYVPKFLTPFVMWLMKIIQKIRRKRCK